MAKPADDAFPLLSLTWRLALSLVLFFTYCITVEIVLLYFEVKSVSWGSEATALLSIVLGLLMNFRNRVAYERWWEARKLWGQLTNDVRNLAGKLAAFIPREAILRSRVAALLAAFPEALKWHLRGEQFSLNDLPGFETETDTPTHVPAYLANRLFAILAQWRAEGLLPDAMLLVLDPHVRALFDVCGACERIKNTPISSSYTTLLRAGLAVNLLASPWFAMADLGWYGLPVLFGGCLFLLGLELIDSAVEEPFGREREDLDLGRYCRTIRESVDTALSA